MTQQPKPTIVVVEDDLDIARLVRLHLEANGFEVMCFTSAQPALNAAVKSIPSAFLLDIMLPGPIDGLDALQRIRKEPELSDVPVIIVSARNSEEDRILGLELGADDYVVKPFSPKELVARVRAVLRRTSRDQLASEVIRVADLVIDVPSMRVSVAGQRIELTPSEFQLLVALAEHPGRVLTRGQLLQALRGVAFESYERAIDSHIKNIRRKLEAHDGAAAYIETVYGVGYRFIDA